MMLFDPGLETPVFRLSGAYFYRLARNIDPLCRATADTTKQDAYTYAFYGARALDEITGANELLRLRASWGPMAELRELLQEVLKNEPAGEEADKPIGVVLKTRVQSVATNFRSVFLAEIQAGDFYAVAKKGAYDTTALAEDGATAFPTGLVKKVPETELDAKQAGRCLAFDLPTAAAFHMHRANEAVVHAYFKALAPQGATVPPQRSLEHWLKAIEGLPNKDAKVVAALRDLKDLHRNPVSHPEQSLESSDEAIALLGAIHTAMTYMLKAIK